MGRCGGECRVRDPAEVEDLYAILSKLVGASLLRVVGPQCFEDSLHEIVVIVLPALQAGGLRDSERLPAFMRTVARRQMVARIRGAIEQRRRFGADVESTETPGKSPSSVATAGSSGIRSAQRIQYAEPTRLPGFLAFLTK